jgi:hypothetical protein
MQSATLGSDGRRLVARLAATALIGLAAVACGDSDKAPASDTRPGSAEGVPTELSGTYRYEITLEEAEEASMVDPEDTYPQVSTVILNDGDLEGGCFGSEGGTYSVEDDRITFHSVEYGSDISATFSVDDQGNLRLTPAPETDPGDAFQCFSQVWTKIA